MKLTKKGNNPVVTAGYFFRGLKLLGTPGLRKFLMLPIAINFLLYSIALALGYYYVNDLIARFIPDWLSWLSWILWPLFFLSFFIIGFFTFTVIANLLAAPFYGKLSAKVATLIIGRENTIQEQPLAKVLFAELRRIGYLVSWAIPLLIISIIPGVNIVAPFLWALFGAWGMALEYTAYPLENDGVLFDEQKQLLKSVRIGALSFGGLTMFGLTLPLLNIVVAPAAVIGATIYLSEVRE
jgi:CysZ protein